MRISPFRSYSDRQKIEGGKEEIPEDVDFMTFMILAGTSVYREKNIPIFAL